MILAKIEKASVLQSFFKSELPPSTNSSMPANLTNRNKNAASTEQSNNAKPNTCHEDWNQSRRVNLGYAKASSKHDTCKTNTQQGVRGAFLGKANNIFGSQKW